MLSTNQTPIQHHSNKHQTSMATLFHLYSKFSRDAVGTCVESFTIQLITVILIYLDFIACSIISILTLMDEGGRLHERINGSASKTGALVDTSLLCSSRWICSIIFYMLKSWTGFTMIYFILEISCVLYAFGFRNVRSHVGYMLDVIVLTIISLSSLLHIQKSGKQEATSLVFCSLTQAVTYCGAVRWLGCLRIWRVVRFVTLFLEDASHDLGSTKEELRVAQQTITEINQYQAKLESSRDDASRMVQYYRQEMETLEEALKLAAADMASFNPILSEDPLKENIISSQSGESVPEAEMDSSENQADASSDIVNLQGDVDNNYPIDDQAAAAAADVASFSPRLRHDALSEDTSHTQSKDNVPETKLSDTASDIVTCRRMLTTADGQCRKDE